MSFWKGFLSIFIDESPRTDLQISVKKMWEVYKKILEDSYFDEIFVATEYQKISHLLERYKFHSDRQLSTIFADMFAQMIQETEMNFQDFVLISTPMHWTRYWIRGFDTIGLIVKKISKITKIPHISLLKTKFSRRQLTLSREERLQNRKKIFSVKKIVKIPEKVILFDDVLTTGSTINECAKVLKNAWVKEIIVCVLATNHK